MMPCPKRDRRKNYIHTLLVLVLVVLFLLANQLNTNISCYHHQGCVNEVMIEFFRSHLLLLVGILVHTVDLT